jgi:hypothetical protein
MHVVLCWIKLFLSRPSWPAPYATLTRLPGIIVFRLTVFLRTINLTGVRRKDPIPIEAHF